MSDTHNGIFLTNADGTVTEYLGGGGGGHTILDGSGTELPQESGLKIVGDGVTITDDPSGERTIISIESTGSKIVQKPTVTVGTYNYNGSEQGPTITGLDAENTVVTNATKVNAGTYTLIIALKNSSKMVWNDLSTAPLTYEYAINKIASTITISPSSVTIDADNHTATASYAVVGDGVVTVTNNNIDIFNMSYADGVITISDKDETSGEGTVTVAISEGVNYLAASADLSVKASYKPDLVAWSSGTDAQIADMIDAYYNNVLTLNEIKSVWSVGDTRDVVISAMSATGVGESHRSQTIQMAILDFEIDTLVTPINGHTKSLISTQAKNCLRDASVSDTGGSNNTEHGYINSSNVNNTGWNSCARRTWCNNVMYPAFPNGFKSMIKQVYKSTAHSGNTNSPTWVANTDYCWLTSEWEIFGSKSYSAETGNNTTHYINSTSGSNTMTLPAGGIQYTYYKTASNRYKLPKWDSSRSSDYWWERSPYASNTTNFCYVNNNGRANAYNASDADGLAPACAL